MRPVFRRSPIFVLIILMAASSAMVGCASKPVPKRAEAPAPRPFAVGLRKALEDYEKIAARGGWPWIPDVEKLQLGDAGGPITLLRRRLAATGDLPKAKESGDLFDEDVDEAVRRFQTRHGLEPDGTVGKATLAALNVPVESRIRQIKVAMVAREHLPKDLGDRAVIVNIPDYRLKVIDGGRQVMAMSVVVGQRRDWQTPLLSSQIKYLILNPKWNVPEGIFEKEMIHHLRKNPEYLAKNNMVVLGKVDGKTQTVDPATIDWNEVNAKNPGYRIVQREGAGNSLGRIKFMFPNPYAVYLHDTPSKSLFKRSMRALSHGCVRVERPMDLAEFLMMDDPRWSRGKLQAAIDSRRNRDVSLPRPVNLYIVYITAWMDDQGRMNFRDDIYGKDAELAAQVGL